MEKDFGIGMFVIVAVAVIVAAVLLQASAQNLSDVQNTYQVANASIAAGDWQTGDVTTLTGKFASSVVVLNSTTGAVVVPASNYTITNNVILADGTLGSTVTALSAGVDFNNSAKRISYVYQPLGYAPEAGTRTIAGLVVLFAALAIAVVVLVPSLRSWVLDKAGY